MARFAAESILHGLVAALAIWAMLGFGRIRSPPTRFRCWLLAISLPALFTPLLAVLASGRLGEGFRDKWSLFLGRDRHTGGVACTFRGGATSWLRSAF